MSDIYLSLTETPSVVTLSQPVVASVMVNTVTVANVVSVNVVTMPAINVTAAGGLTNAELRASAVSVAVTTMPALSISSVSISNFPATQTIAGTVTANLSPANLNSVTIGVRGAVTASLTLSNLQSSGLLAQDFGVGAVNTSVNNAVPIGFNEIQADNVFKVVNNTDYPLPVAIQLNGNYQDSVFSGNPLPISGTVTANIERLINGQENFISVAGESSGGAGVMVGFRNANGETSIVGVTEESGAGPLPISGTVTANVPLVSTDLTGGVTQGIPVYLAGGKDGVVLDEINYVNNVLSLPAISGTVTVGNSVTIGSLPTLAPQLPRVTFIDGSGTVVTANSAVTLFASSTTRSYLLVQVTTGSAFVNVGATATTVNGINLTAGQGYAWETTIPQGLVSLISTTTSSRWVAKEA